MNLIKPFHSKKSRMLGAVLIALGVAAASNASADDTNPPAASAPPPMTPAQMFEGGTNSYHNWIELSTGGYLRSGSKAQFQQDRQSVVGPFGGIQDLHYQQDLNDKTHMTLDGQALFDQHDYKLHLGLTRDNLGYLRFSFDQFRTWYNADGGYYPPTGKWYPLSESAPALDRGEVSFEGGLRLNKNNVPDITFKYTHTYRKGEKGSTIWGYTHPDGGSTVRGLSPSFYDINERSDAFQLDATHHIKATDLGLGFRYENGKLDDALKITQFPGESFAGQSIQQRITDRQVTTYDMFNVHAFTETWFKDNLMFSSGYSYSDLDNKLSGSRVDGSDFDVRWAPDPQSDFGYYGLNGVSHLDEYTMDLNLFSKPSANFTIVPSLRAQQQYLSAGFTGLETLGANSPTPFKGNSSRNDLDVRERLDMTYSGITNWVFSARGEWREGQGDLTQNGGLGPVNGFGVPPVHTKTDDRRLFQKYSLNARWYPSRMITVNVGGYYKINNYNYDNEIDSTPNNSAIRYPAYLVMQNFDTYDGNAGLTLRPLPRVTLVSRYEYQSSVIHTKPDPISGLTEVQSSDMASHIISQNIGWIPWSRLSLQAGFNYVLSKTRTPASDYTQAVLNAQNNYWTLNCSSTFVVDDKTDLNLSYFYYRADDYVDNANVGVPYGAGSEEHGVTAGLVRRLNSHMRLNLEYAYYRYRDQLSGGHNDYDAHLLYSSLQYRF